MLYNNMYYKTWVLQMRSIMEELSCQSHSLPEPHYQMQHSRTALTCHAMQVVTLQGMAGPAKPDGCSCRPHITKPHAPVHHLQFTNIATDCCGNSRTLKQWARHRNSGSQCAPTPMSMGCNSCSLNHSINHNAVIV